VKNQIPVCKETWGGEQDLSNMDYENPLHASKYPLVTVAMPVYNGVKYLKQAIDSVIGQSYANWELIVVNDGSTDHSFTLLEELKRLDNRITVISQENAGQSAARNHAGFIGGGKYIAFLDQDDCYHKRHLENLVYYLETHEEVGMAYANAEIIDEAGNRLFRYESFPLPPAHHPPKSIAECISADLMILPGTVMIHRALFLEAGGFDSDLIGYEDDHLFVRLFMKTEFGRTHTNGLMYRMHGSNTGMKVEVMCKSRFMYYQKVMRLLPDQPQMYWYFSTIIKQRCLKTIIGQYLIKRAKKDKAAVRVLYHSYKEYRPTKLQYRVAGVLMHPCYPFIIFKIAYSVYRKFAFAASRD
jgi:glycosyltransferase involved in cell wall biosynthesis